MIDVVIDTNVFVSALISRRGASYRLLSLVGTGLFEISLSVPLVLEYEDAAKRLMGSRIVLTETQIDDVIDYLCRIGNHREIFFLWRPFLRDPQDEMVLETAVAGQSQFILTFNTNDFWDIGHIFGFSVMTPRRFLEEIGALP